MHWQTKSFMKKRKSRVYATSLICKKHIENPIVNKFVICNNWPSLTFIITNLGFATMHKDVKWVPLSPAIDILTVILKHNIIAWGDCLS